MGDRSEGIEASGGRGSRKAHPVSISSEENRDGAEETVGAGAGGAEEGGLRGARPRFSATNWDSLIAIWRWLACN